MIYIRVKLKSPLAISRDRFVGNINYSLDYIPGSAFRGALASKFIKEGRVNLDLFKEVFVEGKVSFPSLYPSSESNLSFPIPLSAKSCKYKPGFITDRDYYGECHRVIDLLFPVLKDEPTYEVCGFDNKCHAIIESYEGFYELRKNNRYTVHPNKRLIARTAVDDYSRTAKEGLLYSLEVLEEGQGFSGILLGEGLRYDNESKSVLYNHETLLKQGDIMHLGLGTTRGTGEAEITHLDDLTKVISPEVLPPIQDRFNTFKNKLNDYLGFSLTLYSDAIILDDFLRYRTVIDERVLVAECDLDPQKVILKQAFAATRIVPGWNSAWKLPKEDEVGIRAGSVFFFKVDGYTEDELLNYLQKLEGEGIGERKTEGFGRTFICWEFHYKPEGV